METIEEDDGYGDVRAQVDAQIAREHAAMRLALASVVAHLRRDVEGMEALTGDLPDLPDLVYELMDGMLFVITEMATDAVGGPYWKRRERAAEWFEVWISELAGVGPTAKAAAAKAAEEAAARVAAFERQPLGCCLHCGKIMAMDDDGLTKPHHYTLPGPPTVWPRRCPGSGLRPHDVLLPEQHLPYRNGSR